MAPLLRRLAKKPFARHVKRVARAVAANESASAALRVSRRLREKTPGVYI